MNDLVAAMERFCKVEQLRDEEEENDDVEMREEGAAIVEINK